MNNDTRLGGTFTLPGTGISIKRMGYGTMQLPGAHVWGPPRDKAAALAVLKEAVALGVDHIDTAEFYGPHVSNQLIREALHPYADGLRIVTKIGIGRGSDASWNADRSPASLRRQVQDNLVSLGLETLDVVNLRLGAMMDTDTSAIAEPVACLAELQREGLVRHIGLSNITPAQYQEAEKLAKIVCVQNHYNLVKRDDDAFIDALNDQGVAYVPFFPLGGFSPVQSDALSQVAKDAGATPKQVALAWLLQRSPNILVIAGTSSVPHLRENLAASGLHLSAQQLAVLNSIADEASVTGH
ncbi:oxidoreductase [Xanthomonas cannabis]|uniref:Aryl-alcohol dehydrogenase-like predicted oxidoreductase n=1 Tax=Xanthomonas cannabis TaxID=1885674 RepID=A0ABR6JQQ8_9XANT|nr:oxidoreductase [Xanthomonas cannabis]MBB4595153.1 aryl-alcohol dehydrogenase-like predicted oxidoreductase [Xanthomonas cannabis]MBB5523969.1 aryl-alcohol dehydrogenase-like predicted oxidoreductase [Xanthomonas cannabis]NIK02849.1 aryl-alcohol dehydrogenase-like predicted oxidoreductase [Xanthomonas cannabis]NIK66274.1 aryl-alcohol dehydrogenase-like predicted oxidoreductase [Xanthomonas cannabis]